VSTKVREIAATRKAIHASEDLVAAREKAVQVIEKLRAPIATSSETLGTSPAQLDLDQGSATFNTAA
jgi:hypothetical protein